MEFVYVSFSLKLNESGFETSSSFDKDYKTIYAPLIKFLFSHPNFKFSLSFTGPEIEYFKKRHNELFTVCKTLIDRNQIEILGGGFYNPILPLLSSVDRNGQLDKLSLEIRQNFGKRPRGAVLFADIWDSSLVATLESCGFEYVLLDSNIVPEEKRKMLPLIMSDLGKKIDIYPEYSNMIASSKVTVDDFVLNIIKDSEKIEKKDNYFQFSPDRIVNISLSHEELQILLENKWFEKLDAYLKDNPDTKLKLATTGDFHKNHQTKLPCYIHNGVNKKLSQVYNDASSINEILDSLPLSRALYNRIIYVALMLNQNKGDKIRKISAREMLWKAQNGLSLIYSAQNVSMNFKCRQASYKALVEAEKILRQDGNFKESIICFDYNFDGNNEYVCRMENYFAYVSLISGAIRELDVFKNSGNYADNLSRLEKYDTYDDSYQRGIFVDHLFNEVQFESYVNSLPSGDGVFSRIRYSELKFSRHHNEIQLSANALFGATKQPIYLRKKYIVNSNGMNVQYIIKNLSNKPLVAKFAVESNFANPSFDAENPAYFNVEVADCDYVRLLDSKKSTKDLYKKGKLKNVDVVRLSDLQNGVSFAFEPNENCGYNFNPIIFNRPDGKNGKLIPVQNTFVSTLYWDINIESGMETEKNINFTISSIKKEKQK